MRDFRIILNDMNKINNNNNNNNNKLLLLINFLFEVKCLANHFECRPDDHVLSLSLSHSLSLSAAVPPFFVEL